IQDHLDLADEAAGDVHRRDAFGGQQLRPQPVLDPVAKRDEVSRVGAERHFVHRHLLRVKLEDRRRIRFLRQAAPRALEILRRVLHREDDVRSVREAQVQHHLPLADLRLDADQILRGGQGGLQRLGYGLLHHLGLDAPVVHVHPHLRIDDVGEEVEGKAGKEEETEDEHDGGEHGGAHRPANGEAREPLAHGATPDLHHAPASAGIRRDPVEVEITPDSGPAMIRTSAPSRRPLLPVTTTTSPAVRPERISTRPSDVRPVSTLRRTARPSCTTKTDWAPAAPTTAPPGTMTTSARSARSKRMRARKPGRTSRPAPVSSATSTGTSRVLGSAEGKTLRMRPSSTRPGNASRLTCAASPTFSSTTSSSDTPTRTTSVDTSPSVKSRVWLPTTSPASTCFASTTPAIGLRTVAYPIRV